jgi:hypothetical protein
MSSLPKSRNLILGTDVGIGMDFAGCSCNCVVGDFTSAITGNCVFDIGAGGIISGGGGGGGDGSGITGGSEITGGGGDVDIISCFVSRIDKIRNNRFLISLKSFSYLFGLELDVSNLGVLFLTLYLSLSSTNEFVDNVGLHICTRLICFIKFCLLVVLNEHLGQIYSSIFLSN